VLVDPTAVLPPIPAGLRERAPVDPATVFAPETLAQHAETLTKHPVNGLTFAVGDTVRISDGGDRGRRGVIEELVTVNGAPHAIVRVSTTFSNWTAREPLSNLYKPRDTVPVPQIGDRVRIIGGAPSTFIGRTGVVKALDGEDLGGRKGATITHDNRGDYVHALGNIEVIARPAMRRPVVGDRVRILPGAHLAGAVGEVVCVMPHSNDFRVRIDKGSAAADALARQDAGGGSYVAGEIEVIE
jgi:transcription antitermination factor NusG